LIDSDTTATPPRSATVAWGIAAAALFGFATLLVVTPDAIALLPGVVVLLALVAVHRALLSWQTLIVLVLGLLLLVPIRRYELPSALPVKLEPYRLVVALALLGWIAALLVDQKVRLRRTPLDAPLFALVLISAFSIVVNTSRISSEDLDGLAIKQLSFLLTFVGLFYLVVSVVMQSADARRLLRLATIGVTVVAVFAIIEYWSRYNVFSNLEAFLPVLKPVEDLEASDVSRLGHLRVYASAQHPIALSALLVMFVPVAVSFARREKRWLVSVSLLTFGVLATLSRTGVLMLLATFLTLAVLRGRDVRAWVSQLWWAIVPLVLAIHLVVPGAIGSFRELFFPQGGLVAQQSEGSVGSSRGASFGPGVDVVEQHPLLGVGYGTRIVQGPEKNSFIVDDQWLATAMETGLIGLAVLVWLFMRSARVLGRGARSREDDDGWLLAALAASIVAYAVGMATYDAMSFIQVTMAMFLLLALGISILLADRAPSSGATGGPTSARTGALGPAPHVRS
jgi:hypothetical protein